MSAVPLGARRPSEAGEPVSLEAALIIAAALGDIGAVSRSLARGLAADAAPPGKPSALCYAALGNDTALLELMLRHGADVNFRDASGNSPSIYAAMAGSCCCLRALARHGADLSAVNACGDSALARCRDARTRAALLSAMAASPPAHVLGDRSVRH